MILSLVTTTNSGNSISSLSSRIKPIPFIFGITFRSCYFIGLYSLYFPSSAISFLYSNLNMLSSFSSPKYIVELLPITNLICSSKKWVDE